MDNPPPESAQFRQNRYGIAIIRTSGTTTIGCPHFDYPGVPKLRTEGIDKVDERKMRT
jgi:hypothetical protein